MIIIDNELKKREEMGNPIRVALVGAGYMGSGIAFQILTATPGMDLVAISNRHPEKAVEAFKNAGITKPVTAENVSMLEDVISKGGHAVTDDASLLSVSNGIDVLIEATGTVEFASRIVLKAIESKKHVVLVNAELDSTLGPILKVYADRAGVVFTDMDGDEPGVQMNLFRFVKGMGFKPVMCGNIKGLYDRYRNPTTQADYARKWGQKPHMVTSYADGSKVSFEQALVANATGMGVAKLGMYGLEVPQGTPLIKAVEAFPEGAFKSENGIVDFLVGADPAPGVFVIGKMDHPVQKGYLLGYKMGNGPYYCFYQPYHLCHFEVPNTVARAVFFNDAVIAPKGAPLVEVVTVAKTDLEEGITLDGIGGYSVYGLCENASIVAERELLPLGLAEGCIIKRRIKKDEVIACSDIQLPDRRMSDRLYAEQVEYFDSA
jgi:predicted homoserine dehydrogenase-like protein